MGWWRWDSWAVVGWWEGPSAHSHQNRSLQCPCSRLISNSWRSRPPWTDETLYIKLLHDKGMELLSTNRYRLSTFRLVLLTKTRNHSNAALPSVSLPPGTHLSHHWRRYEGEWCCVPKDAQHHLVRTSMGESNFAFKRICSRLLLNCLPHKSVIVCQSLCYTKGNKKRLPVSNETFLFSNPQRCRFILLRLLVEKLAGIPMDATQHGFMNRWDWNSWILRACASLQSSRAFFCRPLARA